MELLIIVLLLFIAAMTTYQVAQTFRVNGWRKTKQKPLFIDTSVLIDGRIIAVAESGFLTNPLYIPRSVLGELQLLADGGDADKRSRARHGLDVVKHLQSIPGITVVIFPDSNTASEGVDNRLMMLAKRHNGALCTIDFNLNKVAQVEGIQVLNVNDLAMSLRMAYLPGEKIMLELTQKGNDSHQAIGHLTDGTMVVVEHASQYVGKTMEVEFIRSLQTAAGKMMFARIVRHETPTQSTKSKPAAKQQAKGRKPQPKEAPARSEQTQPRPARKPAEEAPRQQSQPKKKPTRRKPLTNEERLVELANNQ